MHTPPHSLTPAYTCREHPGTLPQRPRREILAMRVAVQQGNRNNNNPYPVRVDWTGQSSVDSGSVAKTGRADKTTMWGNDFQIPITTGAKTIFSHSHPPLFPPPATVGGLCMRATVRIVPRLLHQLQSSPAKVCLFLLPAGQER